MQFFEIPYEWQPLRMTTKVDSPPSGDELAVMLRIQQVLEEWDGTPYSSGQGLKRVGADCIGAGFGVVEDLFQTPHVNRPKLPADTAMHSREHAAECMHVLRRLYPDTVRIEPRADGLQPMDLLVTGPQAGGPGHLVIVGAQRNTLWQAARGPGFHRTGWGLPLELRIFRTYRFSDRKRWIP